MILTPTTTIMNKQSKIFIAGAAGMDVMKTDTQLYKLFSELPEYFFDLTGIHSSARYTH